MDMLKPLKLYIMFIFMQYKNFHYGMNTNIIHLKLFIHIFR